jgi:TPR repeat protein
MIIERLRPSFRVVCTTLALALPLGAASFSSTYASPLEDELHNGLRALQRADYATAMRLLRPLAERGNASAQHYVGEMYHNGHGVQQSSVQAATWYRKAAEQGDNFAQDSLGIMYEWGEGVPKNNAEAIKWTLMAAKQGNSAAQDRLSDSYEVGLGVPQNYILAYMWQSVAGHYPVRREKLESHMTPSQIAEAQDLAQQCIESHYENCPATVSNRGR